MHIHLPRAFHSWREFAKEVGIIVLGVLIALGFEQLVQIWHWREEARAARQALANEIEYSDLWAEERVAVQQCLRDRIADLSARLNAASPLWTADPVVLGRPRSPIGIAFETGIPMVYRAPHRPWLTDEWQTAKSNGVIEHMNREDARNLEFIYRNIDQLESLQEEEASLQPQISFLGFTQTLPPQSRVQAFVTLARLDYLNAMQAQAARQLLSTARVSGLPLGAIAIGQHATTFEAARSRMLAALTARYGRCVVDKQQN